MSGDGIPRLESFVVNVSDDDCRAASLVCAQWADTAEELMMFLWMLGLLGKGASHG